MASDNAESVEWEFGTIDDDYLSPIEFTEHIMVSPEDKSLTIYNIQEENSGQYVCRIGQTMTAPVYLTVIKANQNFTEVHLSVPLSFFICKTVFVRYIPNRL